MDNQVMVIYAIVNINFNGSGGNPFRIVPRTYVLTIKAKLNPSKPRIAGNSSWFFISFHFLLFYG
jgi:hypothetical protein